MNQLKFAYIHTYDNLNAYSFKYDIIKNGVLSLKRFNKPHSICHSP